MREIKFRAWDKARKEYWGPYDFLNDETLPRPIRNMVVEQYTGLKDKNGKEICEGDLVKGRWWRAKNARLDTEGEIKFNDGWFYIKDDPDGQDRLGVPIHNCYNLEIIGNIHENPELLKEEE